MKSSLLFSSFVIFISGFGVFLLRGLCLLWVFQVVVLVLKFCFFISGLVDVLGFEFCS